MIRIILEKFIEKIVEYIFLILIGGSVAIAEWSKTMNFISPILYGACAVIFILYIKKLIDISKSDRSKINLQQIVGRLCIQCADSPMAPDSMGILNTVKKAILDSLCSEEEKKDLIEYINNYQNHQSFNLLARITVKVGELIKNR